MIFVVMLGRYPARPMRALSGGRREGGERGSVLLLTALLMVVLLGFAGAAVDVRNGYVVRSMLQHAVDDGVLSAQRWSTQVDDALGRAPAGITQSAVEEAMAVARQELQSQGAAGISTVTATLAGPHLTMTARAHVPTFFLRLFHIGAWAPVARADAMLWVPQTAGAPGSSEAGGVSSAGAAPGFVPPPGSGPTGAPSPGGSPPVETWSLGASPGGSWMAEMNNSPGAAPPGPASPPTSSPSDMTSPGATDVLGPCNCDGIAAGDPQTARDALDRMGVTPGDPGPFSGDLTSEMGFGEMQSDPGGLDAAQSDGATSPDSGSTGDTQSGGGGGDSSGDGGGGSQSGDGGGP